MLFRSTPHPIVHPYSPPHRSPILSILDAPTYYPGRGTQYTMGGTAALRSAQTICPLGSYCALGVAYDCPAGRYGRAQVCHTPAWKCSFKPCRPSHPGTPTLCPLASRTASFTHGPAPRLPAPGRRGPWISPPGRPPRIRFRPPAPGPTGAPRTSAGPPRRGPPSGTVAGGLTRHTDSLAAGRSPR